MVIRRYATLVLLVTATMAASIETEKNSETKPMMKGYSLESSFNSARNNIDRLTKGNVNVLAGYDVFAKHLNEAHRAASIPRWGSNGGIESILEAINFAAEKHATQTRKNAAQTPYIIHPIGVADNILSIGKVYEASVLMGALLHDTVEDTDTTFAELEQRFGKVVTALVREVTDDKTLAKEERKRVQIEHAKHTSPEAAIIKLSDKLYNLKDLVTNAPADWPTSRIAAYFDWSKQVVNNLPMANGVLKKAVDETIAAFVVLQV